MSSAEWPTCSAWISCEEANPKISFVSVAGWEPVEAELSRSARALKRLGAATRAAVQEITGIRPYEQAVEALRSGHQEGFPTDPHTARQWPKLPFSVTVGEGGRSVLLGTTVFAETTEAGAYLMPYPPQIDVVAELDLLVAKATCLLTGIAPYYRDAVKALRLLAAEEGPEISRLQNQGSETGEGHWLKDWKPAERTPDWSQAGPRTVPGGLPGLGRRRR